ncbi:MAG: hypothetical protein JST50_18935 [Bacteroidetes bacterium]|jgi:hypothetical protein|nr:hypothetical protein [Bacteroidota bacterium]
MLFLIILILSFISSFFLPWWAAAAIAFLTAWVIGKTSGKTFWSGFGAIFVLWVILALIKSIPNDNILASRVIQLFPLPHQWILLLLITALIGGLVGGLAALSGVLAKKAFSK